MYMYITNVYAHVHVSATFKVGFEVSLCSMQGQVVVEKYSPVLLDSSLTDTTGMVQCHVIYIIIMRHMHQCTCTVRTCRLEFKISPEATAHFYETDCLR